PDGGRRVGQPVAPVDRVRTAYQPRRGVDREDRDNLRVEDLGDLVADEVVHRLYVELLGQPALDGVDDGELGCSLIGLGEQALGLVKQACVLEGNAQAGCERGQQPDITVREGVLAVQVLK